MERKNTVHYSIGYSGEDPIGSYRALERQLYKKGCHVLIMKGLGNDPGKRLMESDDLLAKDDLQEIRKNFSIRKVPQKEIKALLEFMRKRREALETGAVYGIENEGNNPHVILD